MTRARYNAGLLISLTLTKVVPLPMRMLLRLSLVFVAGLVLTGCPSKEGSAPVEDPELFFPDPVPGGPDEVKQIEQAYYGFIAPTPVLEQGQTLGGDEDFAARNGALSLLSYDPALPIDRDPDSVAVNPQSIFSGDNALAVALDTAYGTDMQAEFSVLSTQDTIYAVNHSTGEIRGLRHFSNTVCDIIPSKDVIIEGPAGGAQSMTVVDARIVYIETTEGLCSGDDSNLTSSTRRFYRLPVNYKYDATDIEICVGEGDGRNSDPDTCFSKDFRPVTESEARAKLVFGWTEDDEVAGTGMHKPTWGYLGYGVSERQLRFFDDQRNLLWSQPRTIETFVPVTLEQGEASPKYLFELWPLDNQADGTNYTGFDYLVQIGRDVFALEANSGLFDVAAQASEDVLSDRIYQMDEQIDAQTSRAYVSELRFDYDDDEIVLLDQHKVYRLDYSTSRFTPTVDASRSFTLRNTEGDYQPVNYRDIQPFSQFDIGSCSALSSQAEIDACTNAHDVEDRQLPAPGPAWQFIADCEASLGCTITSDTTDYCVTEAELLANPTLGALNNPCSTADYLDLNELDEPANDAEFRGFMQYAGDFVRQLEFKMYQDSLLITARMIERELLLQYFYNQPLTALRSDREWVLLGRQFSHHGIQAYIEQDNLFIDVLRESATRNNECYKNYQRVTCDLGELVEPGSNDSCTGFDLAQGDCSNTFDEYKSYALFCAAADVASRACQDQLCSLPGGCDPAVSPVYDLLVDATNAPQAKWLPFTRKTLSGSEILMTLLVSDDDFDDPNDATDSYVKDEGVLGRPRLHEVDAATGVINTSGPTPIIITTLEAEVESVSSATSNDNRTLVELISSEVVQLGGSTIDTNISELAQLTIADLAGTDQTSGLLSTLQFLRPVTEKRD